MSLKSIDARKAQTMVEAGALLIDVREPCEFDRERIPGSMLHPMSKMREAKPVTSNSGKVIFLCATGARTNANSPVLAGCTDCEAYVLEGGLGAWKRAGLPVERQERQPVSILRQALMVAGVLAIAGFVLGTYVAPAWHLLSLLVGAGLLFSGTTNFCPMAFFVSLLPWNRNKPRLPGATGIGQFG
ncbi:rhodanese-related sulfurtransferase [Breoghania corrubedonensis]|uniref:Rhodanese-related sulfurtransferase n=1 Tax=Breoghania corrubedonensis TaxID=665038 RepID=A0A2T5VCN2_9HYPH|nr:rhodanese family protein [Breoghania corrubedonensis]PTW61495.1 rhodanese-related sulfurtransferase [Breoghania corrubedonensis]